VIPLSDYATTLRKRADEISLRCAHPGGDHSSALEPPIVLSSAFSFPSAESARRAFLGENDDLIYGRWRNPTVTALEEVLSALEACEATCAAASGMAAVSGALLSLLKCGDHVVAPRSMYAESARLLRERLPRFGIETTFVENDVQAYEQAIKKETRAIYTETPSNPTLALTDLRALAALAHSRNLALVVDNTFATPFCQNPIQLGADLVVHSLTKALSGHGDAIGGAVCGSRESIERVRDLTVKGFGGILSPFTAYSIQRGIRTFALRQERACATAAQIATLLSNHPSIARVHHPSLSSHPEHALARSQMFAFGSIVAFEVGGANPLEAGRVVLESVRVATHAVSLGDVRSLLIHPASTTHSTMPKETRERAGIGDGLLRLSVGIESADNLWADLSAALAAIAT